MALFIIFLINLIIICAIKINKIKESRDVFVWLALVGTQTYSAYSNINQIITFQKVEIQNILVGFLLDKHFQSNFLLIDHWMINQLTV